MDRGVKVVRNLEHAPLPIRQSSPLLLDANIQPLQTKGQGGWEEFLTLAWMDKNPPRLAPTRKFSRRPLVLANVKAQELQLADGGLLLKPSKH